MKENSENNPQKQPIEDPPLPDSYEPTPNKTPEPEPIKEPEPKS